MGFVLCEMDGQEPSQSCSSLYGELGTFPEAIRDKRISSAFVFVAFDNDERLAENEMPESFVDSREYGDIQKAGFVFETEKNHGLAGFGGWSVRPNDPSGRAQETPGAADALDFTIGKNSLIRQSFAPELEWVGGWAESQNVPLVTHAFVKREIGNVFFDRLRAGDEEVIL